MDEEVTFKTALDSRTCYFIRRNGTEMESRYLKPLFKNGRSIIGISEAIALGTKGVVSFLARENCVNSDIYKN